MSCLTGRCAKGARCGDCMARSGLTLPARCSCDPRFRDLGVTDVDCRVHGLVPVTLPRRAA